MTTSTNVSRVCALLALIALDATAQCVAPATVQRVELAGADTVLALPAAYTSDALTLTGGDRALSFEADTDTLSGFLLDVPLASSGAPASEAVVLRNRLATMTTLLGASTVTTIDNGVPITTHDGFGAVRSVRVNLALTGSTNRRTLRNRVMAALGNHALADFGGLVTGGAASSQYSVIFSVLVRPGAPQRLRILGAVGARAAIEDDVQTVRSAADDVADGGPLALASNTDAASCEAETATTVSNNVDLLVANYTGSSLTPDRPSVVAAFGDIFDALTGIGADLRVGVVPNQSNSFQLGAGNGGVLRSGFQRVRQTALNELADITGGSACNFGLTAGDNAIARALPRTASGMEAAGKLRGDAQLIVLYVDGEHAQEVEQNECGLGALGTGQNPNTRTTPNAAQLATLQSIAAPFAATLDAQDAPAFGLLGPLNATFCSSQAEDGRGYTEVIGARGGTFGRVCDSSGSVLGAFIAANALPLTPFGLDDRPIASSLRVQLFVDGMAPAIEVPRSRVDGYEFDREQLAVLIRGFTYRPQNGDRVDVAVRFWATPIFADGFD